MIYGQDSTCSLALRDISLTISPAEFVSIMGTSGSGKTTLLSLAAGLCHPTSGRVELLGRDLTGLREGALARLRRRHVGFVFQTLNLMPAMTVAQNVELPLVITGQPALQRASRVQLLLHLAGLEDKAQAYPGALSNGQQQQVAVLRAVAHRPDIIFLDEPTSSLDSERASVLLDLIAFLNRTESSTVILTTHDPIVADRASRRLHIRDGALAGTF